MAETDLLAVARKAMTDPAFWKKLRANPDSALKDAGMQLSPPDLNYLKTVLARGKLEVDLDQLVKSFHASAEPKGGPKLMWQGWIPPPPPPGRT
jgi:hypothetical protein